MILAILLTCVLQEKGRGRLPSECGFTGGKSVETGVFYSEQMFKISVDGVFAIAVMSFGLTMGQAQRKEA